MQHLYRIEVTDALIVRCGETAVTRFRTHKAQALLAYLVLHPGSHSRDKLINVFWPEMEMEPARHALSTALCHLRGPLEKDIGQPRGTLIRSTRDSIGLNSGSYATDLDELPGDFDPERLLPGFYDDWVLEARANRQPSREIRWVLEPLPAALDAYVEREPLQTETVALLDATRILTVVGPAGVGKTRFVLETLRRLEAQGEAVAWVELSTLTDPLDIAQRIAVTLGLTGADDLVLGLRSTPLLLGLDNCEHLIDNAARETERLLRACPRLRILATSREPLNVPGETILRLPCLTEAESIALFHERAGRALPGWRAAPHDAPLVRWLCARLDGLPFALQLAAAKLRSHSLEELAQRLDSRIAALTNGTRGAEPRHATLEATLAWSYALLADEERALFLQLSVFRGGWTLHLAVALCGPCEALLETLVDKSLVQKDHGAHGPRYRMLETVHELALRRRDALPIAHRSSLHRRFLEIFRAFVCDRPDGEDAAPWARRLDIEYANILEALSLCCAEAPETALGLFNALPEYWKMRALYREQRRQIEAALALPESARPNPNRPQALRHLAAACKDLGDWMAAREALLEIERDGGLSGESSRLLTVLATIELNSGRWSQAEAYFEQALARAAGNGADEIFAESNRATLLMTRGSLPAARTLLQALLDRNDLHPHARSMVLINLALVYLLEGEVTPAHSLLQTARVALRAQGTGTWTPYLIVAFAVLALRKGDAAHAAFLLGASYTACESLDHALHEPENGWREREMERAREVLGDTAFQAAFTAGGAASTERALAALDADTR